MTSQTTRVGLFVSCLVDVMRPSVGFAAARLLEEAGCNVLVPENQTCCGQPGLNSGDVACLHDLAPVLIEAFADCDAVVTPSASCAATLKKHLPAALSQDAKVAQKASGFAAKIFELTAFLDQQKNLDLPLKTLNAKVLYHEACSARRDLGLKREPQTLLAKIRGLTLVEPEDPEDCCGFGGLFAVKFPQISNAIASKKSTAVAAAKPDLIVSTELGCLMNIAGTLQRAGHRIPCRHIAEVLAGDFQTPAIGDAGQTLAAAVAS